MGLVRHRARKTIKKRMLATPKAIKMELRKRMHDPIERRGLLFAGCLPQLDDVKYPI